MKKKLLAIEKIVNEFDETILDAATEAQINVFKNWIGDQVKPAFIEEYIQFLKIANGLDFNGLVVYSIDSASSISIYSMNEAWHENENLADYIFFADSDITWYSYDLKENTFYVLDKPSGEIMDSFGNYTDMIKTALDAVL